MLFIVDEASGVADPIMEAILGTLSGVNNKLLMCGNPTRTSGTFFDAFNKDRGLYKCHTVSSADSQRTNKENIESLIRKYGRDSNVALVRIFGQFPKQEDDVFIDLSIIEQCCMLDPLEDVPIKRIAFGVDVARYGTAMLDACNNDNIGYDQGERSTVISQLEKYGSLKKIATKTEADCGTLVRACCIQAGFDTGNFNTASEGAALEKTGMFESKKSVTSSTELFDGDILVTKTKGHTVIVVSGNPRTSEGASTGSGNSLIKKMQSAKSRDSSLAGTYKTTSNLNLRYGPDKDKYDSIIILPAGTKCQCYGYYTLESGAKWLYVVVSVNGKQYTGFVSTRYLSRS